MYCGFAGGVCDTMRCESDNIASGTFTLILADVRYKCIFAINTIKYTMRMHFIFGASDSFFRFTPAFSLFFLRSVGLNSNAYAICPLFHSILLQVNLCLSLTLTLLMSVFHLMSSQISSFSRWLPSLSMRINKLMICHRIWHWWPSYTVHARHTLLCHRIECWTLYAA